MTVLSAHACSLRHPATKAVVLVDFYWTRDKDPRVPLGHGSILATLRQAGIDVRPFVRAVNETALDPDATAHQILALVGDTPHDSIDVAIGVYVWGEDLVKRTMSRLRALGFRGRIVLGGPQISYARKDVADCYPDADVLIRGYGEAAILQLLQSSGRPAIPGVLFAGEEDRIEQATQDPAELQSPWLAGVVPVQPGGFVRWETKRGCPYRCTFCQHKEPGLALRHRERRLSDVLEEVRLFCRAGVADIAVLDPVFNTGRNACTILREFVDNGFAGRLSLQCRAELVDTEFLDLAARLNVRLEFGLQTIHLAEMQAIGRSNNLARVEATLAGVAARSIAHEVSLIFGLPEQTLASFISTVRWCLDQKVAVIKAFPLMLLRGTQLEVDQARWALKQSGHAMPVVIASSTFTEGDWVAMARISEALRQTENEHPSELEQLLQLAEDCEPELLRWTPISAGGEA